VTKMMKQFDHMIERKLNLELSNVFPRLSNIFARLKFLAGCGQFSDLSNNYSYCFEKVVKNYWLVVNYNYFSSELQLLRYYPPLIMSWLLPWPESIRTAIGLHSREWLNCVPLLGTKWQMPVGDGPNTWNWLINCIILAPSAEPIADIKDDTSEVSDKNDDLDKVTGNIANNLTYLYVINFL
jgi:hypothetical protein